MAADKNVKIVCSEGSFDAKVESLSGKAEPRKVNGKEVLMKDDGAPQVFYKNTKGEPLHFARVKDGKPMVNANGENEALSNGYVNDKGELCPDTIPYYQTIDGEFISATKNEKTEIFEITKFEPMQNFTDKYIVDKYYQVKPSQGKSKKDYQRLQSVNANTREMKKIWDYMAEHNVVGRGILNITSAGYLPSIAYLRPVNLGGKQWTLEIGMFKQQKRYSWVEEMDFKPREVEMTDVEQNVPSIDEI
jgi:hypothetical protein